jgi:hypothetical protein
MNDYFVTGIIILAAVAGYLAILLLLGRFCGMNSDGDDIS